MHHFLSVCFIFTFIHSHRVFISVPTSPPLNPTGVADTSRSLSLSWNPPPPGDQNGMLRHYVVNIIEVETGRNHSAHNTRPHDLFTGAITCIHTILTSGESLLTQSERGPYTNVSTLRTPEDGE